MVTDILKEPLADKDKYHYWMNELDFYLSSLKTARLNLKELH